VDTSVAQDLGGLAGSAIVAVAKAD